MDGHVTLPLYFGRGGWGWGIQRQRSHSSNICFDHECHDLGVLVQVSGVFLHQDVEIRGARVFEHAGRYKFGHLRESRAHRVGECTHHSVARASRWKRKDRPSGIG